jgi:hypothetical protein
MSKELFQKRVREHIEACGLPVTDVDSYGSVVSVYVRQDEAPQSVREFSYQLLTAFPGSAVVDVIGELYRPDVDDGDDAWVQVKVDVDSIPPVALPVDGQLIRAQEYGTPDLWADGWRPGRKLSSKRVAKAAVAKAAAAKVEAVEPAPENLVKVENTLLPVIVDDSASTSSVDVGEIVYTIIPKADGSRMKQAKAKVVEVVGDVVKLMVTKTGAMFDRPQSMVFNHVPHEVEGVWQ